VLNLSENKNKLDVQCLVAIAEALGRFVSSSILTLARTRRNTTCVWRRWISTETLGLLLKVYVLPVFLAHAIRF